MMRPLAVLAVLGQMTAGELAFKATFDESLAPFQLSSAGRYDGQQVSVKDGAMVLEDANHFYGVGAPVNFDGSDGLVVQYEVELTDGLSCGGAYVKLLEAPVDVSSFDDQTPFVIMFGPDKCGATDKVHFILRSQNQISKEWQEHHLKNGPRAVANKDPHLYTAVLKGDSLEILIDGDSAFQGNIMTDMEPPLTPEKEIDDPEDSKPSDWIDDPMMVDPEATKPDDWDEDAPRKIEDPDAEKPAGWLDDEPLNIPDPDASRPDDWDDDEDGKWEPPEISNPKCAKIGCGEWIRPIIDNPEYKGKWTAPKIDNPDYKGVWAPRKIPNPNYHDVVDFVKKSMKPIAAVVVDIWTTNKGITYDNVALGSSQADATSFASAFYEKKKLREEEEEKKKDAKKQKKLEKKLKSGAALLTRAQIILEDLLDAIKEKPQAAGASAVITLLSLIYLFFLRGGSPPKDDPVPAAAEKDKDEQDDDDDDGEKEKPPMAD